MYVYMSVQNTHCTYEAGQVFSKNISHFYYWDNSTENVYSYKLHSCAKCFHYKGAIQQLFIHYLITWLPTGYSSSHMHVTLIKKILLHGDNKPSRCVWGFFSSKCCRFIGWLPKDISKHFQSPWHCVGVYWMTRSLKCEKLPKGNPHPHLKMPFVASVLFCVAGAIKPAPLHSLQSDTVTAAEHH